MKFCATFFSVLLAVVALLGPLPASAAGDGFVPGFDDLPLMAGLVADDNVLVFEAAAGRIVESQVSGAVSSADVLAFYDRALPQLGWQSLNAQTFLREEEQLRIEFPGDPGAAVLTVRFALTPRGGS